jgi:uncharacterized protein (UPF0335 family)
MNNNTKTAIKNQLINWIGLTLIVAIGFYFTAKANIKYNQDNIKSLQDNTVQIKAYNEYVKRIDQLIDKNKELIKAIEERDVERTDRLWKEIENIREDIRSLYSNLGYKTRGIESKSNE